MSATKPLRVLNVNDRDIPRYVNEETLKREGFEVVSVATGHDALKAARDDIDVVLLDVQLPDIDGYEVCARLRKDPETANIIVLLTSATFVTAKNKVTGLDSGADGYLVQPYESAELFATLRSLIRTRVAERKAQALADELRGAMEVRDEFLAMLGHELRNPLASITTALHMMEQHRDPAALDKYLAITHRQTQSLVRIVDDLLDVARLTRGKVTLNRDVLDLRTVMDRCVQSLAEESKRAQHTVELSVPSEPLLVIGDAVRLEQIASNLVMNSIKYTPTGGRITIDVRREAGTARFEVADSGIGMNDDMRKRVFDMFVQGGQSLDRSRGGLGLGLTVVRQLAEAHGGQVSAFSDGAGKGSRFVVQLPIAPVDALPSRVSLDTIPKAAPVRIVLIEDNEEARETLKDALQDLSHEVLVAADGHAGLDLVLSAKPDVALVDIGLPRLDGYEVARQVRAQMDGTAPQLIAMTGYGQPEDRNRAESAGFDMHLVKPVSLARLQHLLASVTPKRPD